MASQSICHCLALVKVGKTYSILRAARTTTNKTDTDMLHDLAS